MEVMPHISSPFRSVGFILFLCFVIFISAFFHFYFPQEGDGDIFYHFKHAEIYAEKGIFYGEFLWLPYTIIGQSNSDQWYGFHLLLIPFTYFEDRVFGLKLAGVFITGIFLLSFYFSLKLLNITKPFFWTIFMFFSASPVLYHLLLIRPHVVSTGLGVLLFAILARSRATFLLDLTPRNVPSPSKGEGNRKKLFPLLTKEGDEGGGLGWLSGFSIFLLSFLISWIHLNLAWLPVLIFLVVAVCKFFEERRFMLKEGFLIFFGLLAGFLLRPHPIGAFNAAYTVLKNLSSGALGGISFSSGRELLPLAVWDLWAFWIFGIVWVGAFVLYFKSPKIPPLTPPCKGGDNSTNPPLNKGGQGGVAIFGSAILSVLFFIMTLLFAQRSYDFWVTFGAIFIGAAFNDYFQRMRSEKKIILNAATSFFGVLLVFMGIYTFGKSIEKGWDIYNFKGASEWLMDNSKEGDVILNASWDQFGFLFFWNSHNAYVSGTAPDLLYAYDKDLYAKAEKLRLGDISEATETLRAFNSRYIFVESNEQALYDNLSESRDFTIAYEDELTTVFRLK